MAYKTFCPTSAFKTFLPSFFPIVWSSCTYIFLFVSMLLWLAEFSVTLNLCRITIWGNNRHYFSPYTFDSFSFYDSSFGASVICKCNCDIQSQVLTFYTCYLIVFSFQITSFLLIYFQFPDLSSVIFIVLLNQFSEFSFHLIFQFHNLQFISFIPFLFLCWHPLPAHNYKHTFFYISEHSNTHCLKIRVCIFY
jgi:hypothetical protein